MMTRNAVLASLRVPVYRRGWGARPRKAPPGRLRTDQVIGLALHWPAMSKPIRGKAAVSAALRSWQAFHQDVRGWSDIAYNEAVDQDGRVYFLRGMRQRSAANGGTTVNSTHGAILLVLGPNEEPSAAMVRTLRRRIKRHRIIFPESRQIVGHGDIRPGGPTECPGPAVRRLIRSGRLT